jgi:hypothetical protein
MLIFPQGFIPLVVEREAQYLAKALRSQTVSRPQELMEAVEIMELGIRRRIGKKRKCPFGPRPAGAM